MWAEQISFTRFGITVVSFVAPRSGVWGSPLGLVSEFSQN